MRVPRVPGALVPFGWSCLARIPALMTPIALVAVVQRVRDDYAVAGLASGLFGAGMAVGAPVLGRLMHRYGQPRVVAVASAACAGTLALLAGEEATRQPAAALLALAALAGGLAPPFTAAMRAVWTELAPDQRTRSASYALDGVVLELLFVIGPLLVSAALLLGPATLPLLISALMVGTGGVGYALTRAVRTLTTTPAGSFSRAGTPRSEPRPCVGSRSGVPGPGYEPASGGGPMVGSVLGTPALGSEPERRRFFRRPGVVAALVVVFATAATMGIVDTALLAIAASDLGNGALIGPMIAFIVAGSVVGGLVFGARAWSGHAGAQSRFTQVVLAVLLVPIVLVTALPGGPPLFVLCVLLAVFGTMLAPCLILQQAVLDDLVPAGDRLPAQAWLASGATAGAALGTALAGVVVEFGGPVVTLGVALLATVVAAAATFRSAVTATGATAATAEDTASATTNVGAGVTADREVGAGRVSPGSGAEASHAQGVSGS